MVPQNKKVKSIRQKVLLHTIYCPTNLQLITQDCLKFERNSITQDERWPIFQLVTIVISKCKVADVCSAIAIARITRI
jgi:hypothetical protein